MAANYPEGGAQPPPPPIPPQPPMPPMKPHRGTMVLVFGILGILCCFIFGILAWVFGNNDLREMSQGLMDPAGRDSTNIGRILGIVGVALTILGVIGYAIVFAVMGKSGAFHNLPR